MRSITILLLVYVMSSGVKAQDALLDRRLEDPNSAGHMLEQCKSYLQFKPPQTYQQGYCTGQVRGLAYGLTIDHQLCPPPNTPQFTIPGEASSSFLTIVVAYIEAHPEIRKEDFRKAIILALMDKWPCHKAPK